MAPMSQEDIEWFKSTFHPIPRPQLPDDCVEYSLYWVPSGSVATSAGVDEAVESRTQLVEVQKSAAELTKSLLKDYIWQREPFRLEISKENGIVSLRGRTNFGDSIEDEWVIVYLLRELSKKHQDIWVRVSDSDGEFLLVEAAGTLPAWLEPEIADNRVWIHRGDLAIIKPDRVGGDSGKQVTGEKITLRDAMTIIQQDPTRLLRSKPLQEEAFYRLRNYPRQISENMHAAFVTIPRLVAYLLHQKPGYVSAAVEAFYLRDPIALRPLRVSAYSNLIFKPEDFVTVSVQFTRVGYAQLKSQDFSIPKFWIGKLPSKEDRKLYDRAELGMKLCCGFEMLLADPQNQDKAYVREIKLLLEDLDTGDEILPTDEQIEQTWSKREDDEKWLDISYEDLNRELKGEAKDKDSQGGFGDQNAQENLQRIVARFEEFLNDNSAGFEGADFIDDFGSDSDTDGGTSSSDDEDKEAPPLDEERLSRMMQEMMGASSASGLPGALRAPIGRVQELDDEADDDTEQIQELSRQMEAELRGTGVLDLSRPAPAPPRPKTKSHAADDDPEGDAANNPEDDDSASINLVRNLLESIQSQAGAAGPGGNILSMMNLPIPKDDRKDG